jgi:hypothetical protein
MKNHHLLLGLLFAGCLNNLYANEVILQGNVKSAKNQPVEFYTIEVFDIEGDTLLIAQDSFTDTLFQIKTPVKEKLMLRFWGYGFEPVTMGVPVAKDSIIHLGPVVFQTKDIVLSEFVITARPPVFQLQGSKMLVNVQNSALKDIGNASEVLNHIPVIQTKNGEYNIFGRGIPDIYIDGQQVQTKNALALLKSDNIADIIIDRNPSAMYNANSKAVILISTKKQLQDMLGVSIQNISSFYRRYSSASAAMIDLKKGIVSANFSYIYNVGNSLIKESSYRYIHNSNSLFFSNLDYASEYKSVEHDLEAAIAIELNEKNKIGLHYSVALSPDDKDLLNKQQIIEDNTQIYHRLIDQNTGIETTEQQVSANYIYRHNNNSELTFILDYIFKNVDKNTLITEQDPTVGSLKDIHLLSGNRYDVYTATLNYKFSIFNKFESVAGLRYAQINNDTENSFDESLIANNSKEDLTDLVSAVFFQTRRKWDKFSIGAGLRYEYDKMKIKHLKSLDAATSRNHGDFFPSLSATYKPTEKTVFELNYSKKISRPSFFYLNSNIFYEDSLSYISGNKNILPTNINRLSFNMTLWQQLSLECNYTHYTNKILQTEISDENIPNKIWAIPVNIKKSASYSYLLSYFFSYKSWSVNCMAMVEIPQLTIPYLDTEIRINKPVYTFSLNNELTLSERFYLYENFTYTSAGYNDLTYNHATNNLTVGVLAKFLKNKLIVGLEATDLLDGSNWNNWDRNYLNIQSGCRGSYDSRGVRISLTYKFNTIESDTNIKKGNSDILNRMY